MPRKKEHAEDVRWGRVGGYRVSLETERKWREIIDLLYGGRSEAKAFTLLVEGAHTQITESMREEKAAEEQRRQKLRALINPEGLVPIR